MNGFDALFFLNSLLLGVGLAMDAFSVSLANGLNEPHMKKRKLCGIAGVFAGFQALMPMTGWFFVHTAAAYFDAFSVCIPWIALLLLGFLGGKMLFEGIRSHGEEEPSASALTLGVLLMQGVATSIDALSVGFTIAEYSVLSAAVCALLVAIVTFCICVCGLLLGRKFGTRLSGKASVLGGVILIAIGLEIFISSFF
ncbi:MAG: manganese efflux pump [Oscillospiraceae bacterium]|nr:manganese efflux pump [Oscillospiraceae bacterium]